jgi:hypothetical protein
MAPTRQRITTWLSYLGPIAVLSAVIWLPDTVDVLLSYILRYSLELVLPIVTHSTLLWCAWRHSSPNRGLLTGLSISMSAISFSVLYAHYTFTTFALVTGIPGLGLIALVLLEQPESKGGNT